MKDDGKDSEIDAFLSARPPMTSPASLADGIAVGTWCVTGFIARGGTAEVYCVRRDDSVAALKILNRSDERAVSRFWREVDFMRTNREPDFPRFIEDGVFEGRPFVVMELLEPLDLPRTDGTVASLVVRVAEGLGKLHVRGLVHRDLKPANIMRRHDGTPVIVDLGLLAEAGAPTLVDGIVAASGTVGYGAPEQFEGGDVTQAADIHALGIVALTCFSGRPPRAWLPIIRRATSSVAEQRFPDVRSFARAVRRRHLSRNFALLGCVLAVAMTGTLFLISRGSKSAKIAPALNEPVQSARTLSALLELNGRDVVFVEPVVLSEGETRRIVGPGRLEADISGRGFLVISNAMVVNTSRVPYPENAVRYRLEKGTYLNFLNQKAPPPKQRKAFIEPYDGGFSQVRFGGARTLEERLAEIRRDSSAALRLDE